MNMVLIPLHGGPAIPLDKAIVFFGRGSECDVVLTDSRKVSRKHCCVAQIDNRIVIRDLGSMNGIRVNDALVKDEGELTVGDVLWVGDLGFRLEPAGHSALKSSGISKRVPLPPKKPSKPSFNARYLSQDIPVALSESAGERKGDLTGRNPAIIPQEEIISLADSDVIEDDAD
ncbi:FHA domain-containing protein [Planctomicrobium sp. SH661]|uniref:FHA domain-containing protein n=1 Tax=Planctomicrobium sp. SH661 TaxID=3448124 RepID=UPI003F5B9D34